MWKPPVLLSSDDDLIVFSKNFLGKNILNVNVAWLMKKVHFLCVRLNFSMSIFHLTRASKKTSQSANTDVLLSVGINTILVDRETLNALSLGTLS